MTRNNAGLSKSQVDPAVLVRNKNGELCKNLTKKDCFPLSRIENTLDTLTGAKWFSTIDLKSSYWPSGSTPGRQEDCVLDGSRSMALHSHVLWFPQRSSDRWEVTGDRFMSPYLRVMSCVPGRLDRDWPHVPRAPLNLQKVFQRFSRSPLETPSGEMPTLSEGCTVTRAYFITRRDTHGQHTRWNLYGKGRLRRKCTNLEASWAYARITDGLFPAPPTLPNRWLQRSKPSSGLRKWRPPF
jgi:hypothetical protein